MLVFSELVPLPVSLSLSSTVPADTKCSSEFSGKLQVICCLPKHRLGEMLTPSHATVKAWRSNPALWGSFYLPHHPPLVYKSAIASPHPAIHQRRGCWHQITPAHSVRLCLLRGNPCITGSITKHAPAGWGLIYGGVGQPPFCFFPAFYTQVSVTLMFCLCMNELGRDLALLSRWWCCPLVRQGPYPTKESWETLLI